MESSEINRFRWFWSLWAGISFLVIWYLPWRFLVNDDVIMMWLVSGAYTGVNESYAVFIHPALSWVFSKAYSLFPAVKWYPMTWYFTMYVSFLLLILTIERLKVSRLIRYFLAFFAWISFIHFCIFPQFTLVAGMASFSVYSLFLGENPAITKVPKSLVFILFGLSCLIRWESVVLMGLGFGLYLLLTKPFSFLKEYRKAFFGLGFILFSLVIGKFAWEKNSEYADFLAFNRIRAGVIDHPIFHQEVVDKKLPANSDMFYFSRWFFEGDNPSIDVLVSKKKDLDQELLSPHQFFRSFERIWELHKIEAYKSFLGLVIVLMYFQASFGRGRVLWFGLIWFVFFLGFNHFFLVQSRVSLLFFFCFLYPVLDAESIKGQPMVWKSYFVIGILILSYHFFNFYQEFKGRAIMAKEFDQIRSGLDDGVPLISEGYQEHNLPMWYDMSNPVPLISPGWLSRSPFQERALQRFGYEDFSEIDRFGLISPLSNTEIVFQDYMNHSFGKYRLVLVKKTEHFIFSEYVRE